MSSRKALGRGLGALLPVGNEQEEQAHESQDDLARTHLYRFDDRSRQVGRVADIDLDLINPNPFQPRRDFDREALEELAASIRQLGVIQPITVRELENGKRYEVISGERRLRAARLAGLTKMPAYIREADTEEMLEMALVENVQRESLNPIEVAVGYQRLIDECTLTQEQVAEKVGKSRVSITNMLRLLKLPPRIQAALRDGAVSMGHARAMLGLENEADQLRLLARIEEHGLSVRDVEGLVRQWNEAGATGKEPGPKETRTVHVLSERDRLQLDQYSDRLRNLFSTQIQIKHRPKGNGGKIEIDYYSNEDLERLMEMMLRD